MGAPSLAAYCATKHGLVGFAEALQHENDGKVRAIYLCPSFVKTGITRNRWRAENSGSAQDSLLESFLARFASTPEKVARRTLWAMKRGSPRVVINLDAAVLLCIQWVSFWLSRAVIDLGYRVLRKTHLV